MMATYDETGRFYNLMEILSAVYEVLPVDVARKIWNVYEKPYEEKFEPWESEYFRAFIQASVDAMKSTMESTGNPYNKPMKYDFRDGYLIFRGLTDERRDKLLETVAGKYYIPNWRECDSLVRHGYITSDATERLRIFLTQDLQLDMDDAEKWVLEFWVRYNSNLELMDPPAELVTKLGLEEEAYQWEEKLGPISLDLFNEVMLKAAGGFNRAQLAGK